MKRPIFLILLLFPGGLIYCQSGYQIANTIKKWNNLACGYEYVVCACNTSTVRFEGDTIINFINYMKVLRSLDSLQLNWTLDGYIHEDTISKEVFYRTCNGNEGLLYDFSLSIGDTVYITNTYMGFIWPQPLYCYNIDSIIINNDSRRRYYLSDPNYPVPVEHDIWIEGIGSIHGLFASGYLAYGWYGGFRELLCYSEYDSIIYVNPPFYQCYMDDFYPKILDDSYDTAFVGASYEFAISITDTNANDSVTWTPHIMPQHFWLDTINGIIYGNPVSPGNFRCWVFVKNWGYQVDLLDTNIVVTYPLSIKSPLQNRVKIFPNPTDGIFNVEIYPSNDITLKLYNSYGELVVECVLDKTISSVDLSKFPAGLYGLCIYNKTKNCNEYHVIIKY